MTNAIVGTSVGRRETEGELDVTTSKPAAQHLRDVVDRASPQPFEGSGCSDHLRGRNLVVTVASAALLLGLLVALLVL